MGVPAPGSASRRTCPQGHALRSGVVPSDPGREGDSDCPRPRVADVPVVTHPPVADVGVIGGSGLYSLLSDARAHPLETPWGPPSEVPVVADVGGRRVAFLPRHGADHRFPPHRVPYRANLWALRLLGVRQVLAPCAVGSLRPELGAGTLVVPDQLVDRTSGRTQTYVESGAAHVSFADPYCPRLRAAALPVLREGPLTVVDGGATVVVEGPRFSTRAESRWFAAQGWSVVNMTGHPEAVLARELAMCYAPVALVTDLDAGVEGGQGVTQEEVFRVFAENTDHLRSLLLDLVGSLPAAPPPGGCPCPDAVVGMDPPPGGRDHWADLP